MLVNHATHIPCILVFGKEVGGKHFSCTSRGTLSYTGSLKIFCLSSIDLIFGYKKAVPQRVVLTEGNYVLTCQLFIDITLLFLYAMFGASLLKLAFAKVNSLIIHM